MISLRGATALRPFSWQWFLWRACRIALLVFLGLVVLALLFEERLIFFPSPFEPGTVTPSGFEDVFFQADDGTKLHGWYAPHPRPRGYLLFCHGNAGNISHRDWIVHRLVAQLDATVFIFDYRGYGRSEGSPDEEGVLADARAARAELARLSGIDERQIVLLGESIGGAIAVDLAAQTPARGLILESTFNRLPDVAAHHYPLLPVRTFMRNRFDSETKIVKYTGPLLQYHSRDDEIVPFALGRRLFDLSPSPAKQFVEARERGHNDGPSPEFELARARFLDTLPPLEEEEKP